MRACPAVANRRCVSVLLVESPAVKRPLALPGRAKQNGEMSTSETFILIPGRTSRQGTGISIGKFGVEYQEEITTLLVPPEDMKRLSLSNGDRVRLTSEWGQVEVAIIASKGDDLPPGLLFIAYGDLSSRLMGGDTHGSGMPTSKGLDVTLEKV